MSLKTVENVKRDKGFRLPDLIVYCALIAIIALSFILWFSLRNSDPLTGVYIVFRDETIFEYDFEDGVISANESYITVEVDGSKTTVHIKTDYGENYLVLEDNRANMVDADCGGECVYMTPISDNSGVIYCAPHYLKVLPMGYEVDDGYIPAG